MSTLPELPTGFEPSRLDLAPLSQGVYVSLRHRDDGRSTPSGSSPHTFRDSLRSTMIAALDDSAQPEGRLGGVA